MSIKAIIKKLEESELFDKDEFEILKLAADKKTLLDTLVTIYEGKIENYLSITVGIAIKAMKLEGEAAEHIAKQQLLEYAYSAFYMKNKTSLPFAFIFLLKNSCPDLSLSLGVSGSYTDPKTKESIHTEEWSNKVLSKFLARYMLMNTIGLADLQFLVIEEGVGVSDSFPIYLFQAFLLQHDFNNAVARLLAKFTSGVTLDDLSKTMSEALKEDKAGYAQAALRIFGFYLTTLLKGMGIAESLLAKHFSHFNSEAGQLAFANALAQGFVHEVSSDFKKLSTVHGHAEAIFTDKATEKYSPALSILSDSFAMDLAAVEHKAAFEKSAIDKALADCKTEISNNASRVLTEAKQKIEAKVIEIKRDVDKAASTFYAEVDKKAAEIRNRPTVWSIGTQTGEFHF